MVGGGTMDSCPLQDSPAATGNSSRQNYEGSGLGKKDEAVRKRNDSGGEKSCFYRNCFIILFSDESCVQICFYDFERRKGKMFQVNPNLE